MVIFAMLRLNKRNTFYEKVKLRLVVRFGEAPAKYNTKYKNIEINSDRKAGCNFINVLRSC